MSNPIDLNEADLGNLGDQIDGALLELAFERGIDARNLTQAFSTIAEVLSRNGTNVTSNEAFLALAKQAADSAAVNTQTDNTGLTRFQS